MPVDCRLICNRMALATFCHVAVGGTQSGSKCPERALWLQASAVWRCAANGKTLDLTAWCQAFTEN